MEALTQFVNAINGIVWGPPMLIAILGTGLFLQLRLKLMPIFKIGMGFKWVLKSRTPEAGAKGDITPYAALMTALAAGRGISLPSQSSAGAAYCARATGAYARIREQFKVPIGKFEGIEEPLARIAGTAYQLDAARRRPAHRLLLGGAGFDEGGLGQAVFDLFDRGLPVLP